MHRTTPFALLLLLLLLVGWPALAQTASPAPSTADGTATAESATMDAEAGEDVAPKATDEERLAAGQELIAKALLAHGGDAFRQQTAQVSKGTGRLRPVGQAVTMDVERLVVYKVFKPQAMDGKDRIEMSLPQGEMVQVFDGEEGWVLNSGHYMDQTARLKNRRFYGYDVLRRFDASSHKAKQLDNETAADRELLVVEVNDGQGHVTKFYLDPETHRVFQVVYALNNQEVTERYADYRSHGGVQVPTNIELYQELTKVLEFEVSEVQVNGELDASLFAKPDLPE